MKNWTETQAMGCLNKTSDVDIKGKCIFIKKRGLSGLMACSALDYLANHCQYKAIPTNR